MSKLELNNITLIAVGSTKVAQSISALEYSMQNIDFPIVKLITHEKPANLPEKIKFEQCRRLKSSKEYSFYVIYDLHNHIETDYCLLIQWDGFVINPLQWNNNFLEWDYIGAPWPIKADAYIDPFGNHIRVGNGGFTLRSKNLLDLPKYEHIPFEVNQGDFYKHMDAGSYNEDGNICVHNRHIFEKHGIKFAPIDIAAKFSQELPTPESEGIKPFGFHRHLPKGSII